MSNNEFVTSKEHGQHSAGKSVLLHLVPGVIVALLYIAFIPLVQAIGYPSILALFLAVLFGGIPFQLGYVLYQAKKLNGNYSFRGVFAYNCKSQWWYYAIISIVYIPWCIICFLILPKFYNQFIMDNLFFWVPEWFFPNEGSNLTLFAVCIIIIAGFVSNILGAVIEELYFRGILLPKVSWMGKWAPLFTTFLFTMYHFDSIWQSFERFLSILPLVLLVWWKKDLKMIIIPHCVLNAVSIVLLATELISK